MVATALAGYVGPGLLGLGAAYLLRERHALAVLWLAVLLLGLLLLQIRNFYGLYAVAVAGAAVLAVSWWGSERVQSLAAWTGTWFLLLAAPRPVIELQRERWRGRARSSDADVLARLTRVPGVAWVLVFLGRDRHEPGAGGELVARPGHLTYCGGICTASATTSSWPMPNDMLTVSTTCCGPRAWFS